MLILQDYLCRFEQFEQFEQSEQYEQSEQSEQPEQSEQFEQFLHIVQLVQPQKSSIKAFRSAFFWLFLLYDWLPLAVIADINILVPFVSVWLNYSHTLPDYQELFCSKMIPYLIITPVIRLAFFAPTFPLDNIN